MDPIKTHLYKPHSPLREVTMNMTASLVTTVVNHPIANMRNLLISSDGPMRKCIKSLNYRVLFSGLPTYMASTPIFVGMGSLSYDLRSRATRKKGKLGFPEYLMIPMLSGAVFGVISQPIDYTVYHQILGRRDGLHESITQVFRRLYKSGGVTCLYRGVSLTAICYTNSSLMLFGLGPLVYYQVGRRFPERWDKFRLLTSALICGCLGAIGSSVIHPIDTVRLRYQKDYKQVRYLSIRDTMQKMYLEHGVRGFYRLWMMRLVSSYATSFFYALIRGYGREL